MLNFKKRFWVWYQECICPLRVKFLTDDEESSNFTCSTSGAVQLHTHNGTHDWA